jgi:hypothetical protein
MRASVVGATDITTTSQTYTAMAGTSLTFTPNKSTVYITATAAGWVDPTKFVPCYVDVQLYNVTTGTVITGTAQVANSMYTFKIGATTYSDNASSWNCAMTTPLTVTPGTPVTIELRWNIVWTDNTQTNAAYCYANTGAAYSHRNIIVIE